MSAGYNLTYDFNYLNDIKRRTIEMEKKNPYWQPHLYKPERGLHGGYSRMVGGKLSPGQDSFPNSGSGQRSVGFNNYSTFSTFYDGVPKSYKSSGNKNGHYYHQNELDRINKSNFPVRNYEKNDYKNSNKNMSRDEVKVYNSIMQNMDKKLDTSLLKMPRSVSREGGKMPSKRNANMEKKIRDKLMKAIEMSQNKEEMKGGSFDSAGFESALKKVKKVGQRVAPVVAKTALPAAAAAVAQALGVPAPVGALIGKIAADVLVEEVIKKKPKKSGGVGRYEGGKQIVPIIRPVKVYKEVKSEIDGINAQNKGLSTAQRRAKLVKELMLKSKKSGGKMSLGDASRYIKQNNLKY
jgi:hypothetical protein